MEAFKTKIKLSDLELRYPKKDVRELAKGMQVEFVGGNKIKFFKVGEEESQLKFSCTCQNRSFDTTRPCKHICAAMIAAVRFREKM